jgi:hypothetical protein
MFRADVDSLEDYLDFDPKRKPDLQRLDKLIRTSAPGLNRHFHRGTPAGEPGKRFKMIGYGKFQYLARSGKYVDWPSVGVALQKNYIRVYLSVMKDGASLIQPYSGKLGELKVGRNNFSFRTYEDLNVRLLALAVCRSRSDLQFGCLSLHSCPRRHEGGASYGIDNR